MSALQTMNTKDETTLGTERSEHDEQTTLSIRKYLLSSLRVDWLFEAQLLLQTFGIGIQDAISFPDFHCFASNQTGNSVVLAVGLAGYDGELFIMSNVGISLGMFVAGAFTTGQIAHFLGARSRYWLILIHSLQTFMVFGAAIIQYSYGVQQEGPSALGVISLLAFSSGSQVSSMRPFRVQEITTAMATAAWVDLVIDPELFVPRNRRRDRRAGFLGLLIAGSFAGAFMRERIGSPNALVVAAACKVIVTLVLLLNRREQQRSTLQSPES